MQFAKNPTTKALSYTNGFPCFFNVENYQPDLVYEQKKLEVAERQANRDWQYFKLSALEQKLTQAEEMDAPFCLIKDQHGGCAQYYSYKGSEAIVVDVQNACKRLKYEI